MLNPAQEQAVRVDGHCLITAPPGSGKTKVLEHRAASLLKLHPGKNLVGVTFTADAAAELEARIRRHMPDAKDRLICGTFHSLCKRQLEKKGQKFLLVNENQQADLMRRAYVDTLMRSDLPESEGIKLDEACAYIDRIKCSIDPVLGRSPREMKLFEVYTRYQELLQQLGAMDFADLLVRSVRGMKSNEVDPYDAAFVLADEFQDTDEIQYAWIREHQRRGAQVTVVGDDDQSIFGFRSALGYRALENFRRESAAAHVALNITYRCAREIITPAARLIAHNELRVEKVIQTANKSAGTVALRPAEDAEAEYAAVVQAIISSGRPGDWGVLARSNAQLDLLELHLTSNQISYVRSGGTSFWDMRGPALFLGVCHSMASGTMVGVDELLRKCGVGEDRLGQLHTRYRSRAPGALYRFLEDRSEEGKKDVVQVTRQRLREWTGLLKRGSDRLALYGLRDFIRVNAKLYERERSKDAAEKDYSHLTQCVNALCSFKGALGSRMVALKRQEKKQADGESVRLMTLHASKGLEFRRVWIVGCEQGSIPSKQSDDIPEERRLFYVGMTRAIDSLYLSYVLREKTDRSMFLAEAGL